MEGSNRRVNFTDVVAGKISPNQQHSYFLVVFIGRIVDVKGDRPIVLDVGKSEGVLLVFALFCNVIA